MIRKYVIVGAGAAFLFHSEIFTLALLSIGAAVLVYKLFSTCAERSY